MLQAYDVQAFLQHLKADNIFPFPRASDREGWAHIPAESRADILRWGTLARQEGYPMLEATRFMAFSRTGDRRVFEAPYFERRKRLIGAALSECLCHDGSFMDAVADGVWCICEESTWAISAHQGGPYPLADKHNPCIDLFAAQTAATLSFVCFLLLDEMDAVTPLLRRRVLQEMEERIFTPFETRDDYWWMGVTRKDLNNWTPWILSNVIDTFLLLEKDRHRLALNLHRSTVMLERYLSVLPRDGGCDEGCAYWNVAGASLLDCLDSLYRATDGHVNVFDDEKIRNVGRFPLYAHISGPWYWNFADCDARPLLDGERLAAYGCYTGDGQLMAFGEEMARQQLSVMPKDTPQMNRVLYKLFRKSMETDAFLAPETVVLPDLQAYAFRRGDWYGVIKGGHNDESHNHNDVGSFILYHKGESVLVDAGNMIYTAKTFGPDRYTLWNTRARNHNIPLIGGMEQQPGRQYAAADIQAEENGVSMQLKGAYPEDAGLESFVRRFTVTEDGLQLSDHILTDKEITWVFLSAREPRPEAGCIAFDSLRLCYPAGLEACVDRMDIEDARMRKDYQVLWRITLKGYERDAAFSIVYE